MCPFSLSLSLALAADKCGSGTKPGVRRVLLELVVPVFCIELVVTGRNAIAQASRARRGRCMSESRKSEGNPARRKTPDFASSRGTRPLSRTMQLHYRAQPHTAALSYSRDFLGRLPARWRGGPAPSRSGHLPGRRAAPGRPGRPLHPPITFVVVRLRRGVGHDLSPGALAPRAAAWLRRRPSGVRPKAAPGDPFRVYMNSRT